MFKNYFKTSFRNLWKNKTYSFLNIFGLAIGIACAGVIFLWVEDEITFDNVHVKKKNLYRVNINTSYSGDLFTMVSTPRPMAAALKTALPGIAATARVSDEQQRLLFSFGDHSMYETGLYTDPALFGMFSFSFIQGNAKKPFPQLYSMIITERTAKKFFGQEKNILGKAVRVDNKHDYIISAVVKDMPENSSLQFEWLAPYEVSIQENRERWGSDDAHNWGSYGPFTYVELEANANAGTINQQLKKFIQREKPDEKTEAFLFPMKDWRLYGEFQNGKPTGGGRIVQVHMLSAIAWIILLIACINFMNLATASSQKRAREVGVRKVLGAGKRSLVLRFIGEALLMSAMASILAVIIISLVLPAFNLLMQKNLLPGFTNPFHIGGLVAITVTCGLVAGSYPSLYLSSFNPVSVLKGLTIKAGGAQSIRRGLVVIQFTVSVVFIICTIIVYQQIQHVKNRKLGFNRNNLVEINMQHDIANIFPLIKQDLLSGGQVENAATSDHVTIHGGNTDNSFRWQGKPPEADISIAFRNVSPEFISVSGMHLIEGRDFYPDAGTEQSSVIITESFAKMLGNKTAVGKIIQSPRGNKENVYTDFTVVGVIADYIYGNMFGKSGPVLFFCRPPEDNNYLYVRIKDKGNVEKALEQIAAVMKKDNAAYPFEYKFVDDEFNNLFFNEMLMSKIAGIFATLAIIISCLGLFGLAAYTAERRTKEIGIRKVLGASVTGLVSLLSKDFIQLIIIACIIAFPVSWWIMHNWLQGYEYRIAMSWWIFAAAGLVALLIALLTISVHAIKAAITNPVISLRTE